MKSYEAMYIIQPNLPEDERATLIKSLNGIFSEVEKVDEWGMRELAYEIEDHKNGYYVVVELKATSAEVEEFERVCRIKEDVIRFMIIAKEV